MSEQDETKKNSPQLSRRAFLQASLAGAQMLAGQYSPVKLFESLTASGTPAQVVIGLLKNLTQIIGNTDDVDDFFYPRPTVGLPEDLLAARQRYIDLRVEQLACKLKLQKLLQSNPALHSHVKTLRFDFGELPKDKQDECYKIISGSKGKTFKSERLAYQKAVKYLAAEMKKDKNLSDSDAEICEQLSMLSRHDLFPLYDSTIEGEYIVSEITRDVSNFFGNNFFERRYTNRPDWEELQPKLAKDVKVLMEHVLQKFQNTFPEFSSLNDELEENLNGILQYAQEFIRCEKQQEKAEQKESAKSVGEEKPSVLLTDDLQNYIDAVKPYVFKETMRREQSSKENQQTRL